MEAKKCDRCGKLYEYISVCTPHERYEANDSIIIRRCDIDGNERKAEEWDLCPDCKADFERWIEAGGFVKTAEEKNGIMKALDAMKEKYTKKPAEVQRVNAGEYWQDNDSGEIVKIISVSAECGEVWYKGASSKIDYYNSTDFFLKRFTKKGDAE